MQRPWGRNMLGFREISQANLAKAEQERRLAEVNYVNLFDLAIWEQSALLMPKEILEHYPKSINFISYALCKLCSWNQNASQGTACSPVSNDKLFIRCLGYKVVCTVGQARKKMPALLKVASLLSIRKALLLIILLAFRNIIPPGPRLREQWE